MPRSPFFLQLSFVQLRNSAPQNCSLFCRDARLLLLRSTHQAVAQARATPAQDAPDRCRECDNHSRDTLRIRAGRSRGGGDHCSRLGPFPSCVSVAALAERALICAFRQERMRRKRGGKKKAFAFFCLSLSLSISGLLGEKSGKREERGRGVFFFLTLTRSLSQHVRFFHCSSSLKKRGGERSTERSPCFSLSPPSFSPRTFSRGG